MWMVVVDDGGQQAASSPGFGRSQRTSSKPMQIMMISSIMGRPSSD
jgi:hypothetical protein